MTAGRPVPAGASAVTQAGSVRVSGGRTVGVVLGMVAALGGLGAALVGLPVLPGVGMLVLAVMIVVRPVVAVHVYLVALPFLSGIDRDQLLPLVRPNEAVLVLVLVAAAVGGYLRYLGGSRIDLRPRPLDVPLVVFVLLSTLWPVVSMLLRGAEPAGADLAALLPICKLFAFFLLVRATVVGDREMVRTARCVLWPAAAVAVIAILQTLGFRPVVALLGTLWAGGGDAAELTERGSTTFASSIATGDYLALSLALLGALAIRGLIGRTEAFGIGLLLGAGVLAAGQFSTWAAVLIVGFVMLREDARLRQVVRRLAPAVVVVAAIGAPALITRLSQFGDGFGVPRSWLGRWDNLVSFYLPALGNLRFVLGVSPDSVLRAPETWREVIYLEYGYLQLLWVGGIPLLVAFVWLSVLIIRHCRVLTDRDDAVGAYASTFKAAWWMVLVLSLIDIHLVLRGTGELLFLFLAIVNRRSDDPEPV